MIGPKVEAALEGMSRRDLEDLAARITRQLQSCTLCGREGAETYSIARRNTKGSIVLCRPCFEQHRLPEGRAEVSPVELARRIGAV